MNTMVTFRTDETLKNEASNLFDSLGLNLSTAINIFLKQAVMKKCFPCPIDYEVSKNYSHTYPKGFFNLFGAGKNLGFDEEPEEISWKYDAKREKI